MKRDIVRNKRLDSRTPAGIVAGAAAAELHEKLCPTQTAKIVAENDDVLTVEQREKLVNYRRQLFETTGKVFTEENENFLDILAS
jgi:hypothetical protein